LEVSAGIDEVMNRQGKRRLKRIVSMVTKLVQRGESVAESSPPRDAEVDYDYVYEHDTGPEPEPGDEREWPIAAGSNG
jgi:hypothetical protein